MAHALELFFDEAADELVRDQWQRLEDAGVPSLATRSHQRHRPHVTLAVAGTINPATRKALRSELSVLATPDLWLSTLGTFAGDEAVLFLGAVVDTEVLALHSAVHDLLAGKVTNPSAYYFPGAWIPHCTLAKGVTAEQIATGFALLQPPHTIRARVKQFAVVDTRTGDEDLLLD